jgi:hypothetical protein
MGTAPHVRDVDFTLTWTRLVSVMGRDIERDFGFAWRSDIRHRLHRIFV